MKCFQNLIFLDPQKKITFLSYDIYGTSGHINLNLIPMVVFFLYFVVDQVDQILIVHWTRSNDYSKSLEQVNMYKKYTNSENGTCLKW